jgi:hypothetical protein
VKSRISVALRVARGLAAVGVLDTCVEELELEPQPVVPATTAARTQATAAFRNVDPRISRARIGAPWGWGGAT